MSDVHDTACIIWTGSRDDGGTGYGRTRKARLAHREAYEQVHGAIPDGLELHHICENRGCVNPEHLLAVTRREHKRIHLRGTHCKKGHEWTAENTYVRPTGQLTCRACQAERARRYRQGKAVA